MNHPRTLRSVQPTLAHSWLALLGVLLLAGAGCQSLNDPASSSFAAVVIANHSEPEIAQATAAVFMADGYQGGASGAGQMTFEKAASQATTLAREGVLATHYGRQTVNRVRVTIVALGANSHRLQCKAYLVKGGSDPFFQDEVPLADARSGPYQALLDKVKGQLK
jgi:hypothetical protein